MTMILIPLLVVSQFVELKRETTLSGVKVQKFLCQVKKLLLFLAVVKVEKIAMKEEWKNERKKDVACV